MPAATRRSCATPSAHISCAFNASAAAAKLKVNDRTIAYRLNNIEQLLGRPVRARHTELRLRSASNACSEGLSLPDSQ
jgi:sugar diacid utilization regulator